MVCATDTALRDFSATCLKEFLKWSVKQASQKVSHSHICHSPTVWTNNFSVPSVFRTPLHRNVQKGALQHDLDHAYNLLLEKKHLEDNKECKK